MRQSGGYETRRNQQADNDLDAAVQVRNPLPGENPEQEADERTVGDEPIDRFCLVSGLG